METVKMKNKIIKILWKYSMFNKGVINQHHYEDMASEIVNTVAQKLHKTPVSGQLVCPDCAGGRDEFEPDWKCPECRRKDMNYE